MACYSGGHWTERRRDIWRSEKMKTLEELGRRERWLADVRGVDGAAMWLDCCEHPEWMVTVLLGVTGGALTRLAWDIAERVRPLTGVIPVEGDVWDRAHAYATEGARWNGYLASELTDIVRRHFPTPPTEELTR